MNGDSSRHGAQSAMHIHLDVGSTGLDLTLPVPPGPTGLRSMLPAVRELSNAFIRIGTDGMASQGQAVSCRAGCAACCRQLVPIAPVEAHALRELVGALPAERQAVVRQRFDDACRQLNASGFFTQLDAAGSGPAAGFRALVEAYFSLAIACPFLDAGCCSIHESRPVACREYLVTSPAERCASPSGDGVNNVVHMFKVKEALLAVGRHEQAAGGAGFVPMIRALEWSAAQPETSAQREPKEWLDALFTRMNELL